MEARLRSWRQQIKKHRVTILVAIILVVAIVLIIVGYRFDWTGFNGNSKSGKTLWDWMQLLFIPLVLAVIAIFFNRAERKNEQAIATDNQQEAALQAYLDKMSELLLKDGLRKLETDIEVRSIARARTLTVLSTLDGDRKGSLLKFLYEVDLISLDKCIINLHDANLNDVNLFHFNLQNADLSGAYFQKAILGHVNLSNAKLIEVRLTWANLGGANLSGANLSYAWMPFSHLIVADLQGADLRGADLRGAIITQEQLATAKSLKGATMPDGSIHP